MAIEPQFQVLPPELEALPPLPTLHQAAVALNMSYKTVRRRIAEGDLLAYRIGPRSIRVDRDSLLRLARAVVIGA